MGMDTYDFRTSLCRFLWNSRQGHSRVPLSRNVLLSETMASEAPPASDISSLFAKKKGKKGKRAVKGSNLNLDSGIPKPAE